MKNRNEIQLSLLDNSHAYLNESVTYALSAQEDVRKWQFAILNLVQSLELSLKSLLHDIHPMFVYEDLDSPKNTISPMKAFNRLNNPLISKVKLSEAERRKLSSAIELRNQMTHSEFTLWPEYAMAKYFEVFGFVSFFQASHLNCEIETIISKERLQKLLKIEHIRQELAKRALSRIAEEEIEDVFVLECPVCQNDTFVVIDEGGVCYTCRWDEEVFECPKCGDLTLERDMYDFSDEFDTGMEEGYIIIGDTYGYNYSQACSECVNGVNGILEDISNQRLENEYRRDEEEYY